MLDVRNNDETEIFPAKHESPLSMVAPMAILAFLGVASWVVNAPWYHGLTNILGSLGAVHESIHLEIALLGFGASLSGFMIALALYSLNGDQFIRRFNITFLHRLLRETILID